MFLMIVPTSPQWSVLVLTNVCALLLMRSRGTSNAAGLLNHSESPSWPELLPCLLPSSPSFSHFTSLTCWFSYQQDGLHSALSPFHNDMHTFRHLCSYIPCFALTHPCITTGPAVTFLIMQSLHPVAFSWSSSGLLQSPHFKSEAFDSRKPGRQRNQVALTFQTTMLRSSCIILCLILPDFV